MWAALPTDDYKFFIYPAGYKKHLQNGEADASQSQQKKAALVSFLCRQQACSNLIRPLTIIKTVKERKVISSLMQP